ncbi:MAG: TetR/AcrR family transcriptional regulator [Williamsia herbipolensis]|nr:TetR/AcrR family transcriptional regulator [Williamsia herbipolensis]
MTVSNEDARVARTRADVSRTVRRLLAEEGWDAVTHAHVARVAGYSKTTLYTHWPARSDLLRIAVESMGEMPHAEESGDLRADLIAEVMAFRTAIEELALDKVLMALAQQGATVEQIGEARKALVADGERHVRHLLSVVADERRRDAAVQMMSGVVLCPAVMYGDLPDDHVIAEAVDILLGGLGEA